MPLVSLLTTTSGSATGDSVDMEQRYTSNLSPTIHASVTGTGAVSATVVIEVSNNPTVHGWDPSPLYTFTLSGTTNDNEGLVVDARWPWIRARTTAISGTGATVSVTAGA